MLRAYGDTVKEAMKQVLWAIAAARQDGVTIDVSGMDEFDIEDFGNELDDAKKLLDLGIGSETLKKQVFKKLAFKYLSDARQEIKNRVAEEIERGGSRTGLPVAAHRRHMEGIDIQAIVRQAVQEFVNNEQAQKRAGVQGGTQEERKRREQLERRMNELVEENKRSRKSAEEAERSSAVRAELQRLGVAKIDLAFKAVQDGIVAGRGRAAGGRGESGEVPVKEYLTGFRERESGVSAGADCRGNRNDGHPEGPAAGSETVSLEQIRPGMSAEEMQRVREEIVRVASQTLKGL